MKRQQKMVGPGCIDKIDTQIKAQQIRRMHLMHSLHYEFGVPWQSLFNNCEARLQEMLCSKQTYNTEDLVFTTSTDGVIRGV
jgi:hypothetical protein